MIKLSPALQVNVIVHAGTVNLALRPSANNSPNMVPWTVHELVVAGNILILYFILKYRLKNLYKFDNKYTQFC